MIKIADKNYEWKLDEDYYKEWRLYLSTTYENADDLPFAILPTMKGEDNRSHLLRLGQSEPTELEAWYYGHHPKYKGKTSSKLILNFLGFIDLEYVTEAYFLNGKFKTGRMPTKGGRYTEDLREFKDNLSNNFEETQEFGWPPFGEYLGNILTNSNLPKDVANSFIDLIE